MQLIREPKEVDFYVIDREPTEEEAKMLSERIQEEKDKKAAKCKKKGPQKPKTKVA